MDIKSPSLGLARVGPWLLLIGCTSLGSACADDETGTSTSSSSAGPSTTTGGDGAGGEGGAACVPSDEVCNGVDDDCDGTADNGDPGGGEECDTGGVAACATGVEHCVDGEIACVPDASPQPELCNGIDDDCDGEIDQGNPEGGGPCDTGLVGACSAGTVACDAAQLLCVQDVQPAPETCDGADNDCNGTIDEGDPGGGLACDTGLEGICSFGTTVCAMGGVQCVQNDQPTAEVCNTVDDDCDGVIDPGCTSCDYADFFKSSVGCVYYAVDANNDPFEGYDSLPYAVIVSNVDAAATATVDVQTRQGGIWTTIQTATVGPEALHQFDLPDRHVNYTSINPAGAYRVVSDSPIVAYQFQPVNGATSFTSDASLLLPVSALDVEYFVAGWGKPSFGNAQLVIVASEDNTVVTFTPTTNTVAGGSVPALTAGVQATLPVLNAGDYLQIEAGSTPNNGAFVGSQIVSDKPISVFSNHWCANIPTQVCCCDHLEEQLMGVSTLGNTYVASRHPVRNVSGAPEAAYWHVVATEDATTVTFSAAPSVTGLPMGPQLLDAGAFLQLGVSGDAANPGDFVVESDKPVLLMQYMSSSQNTNAPVNQAGDPFMLGTVPVEQYLSSYVVLVPSNWSTDWFVLTKLAGSTVNIDGVAVPQSSFIPVGNGAWEVARMVAPDGVRLLDGSSPFGVLVMGYDAYDSYAYPGGLGQATINP